MDRDLPDGGTVRAVLALAGRAPSVHNDQPWRWRLAGRGVDLYLDPDRVSPVSGPGGRDVVLGCGAALHHLATAFAAAGWASVIHRLPDPADPDHLAAVTLVSHRPTEQEIAMSAAIRRRRTDRRRYAARPVPAGHLGLLSERALALGAVLRPVAAPVPRPDHARLLVLSTSSDDRMSRLRAGEALSAVLLTATNIGLANCPLTDPLDISGATMLDGTRCPQAFVRVGWAPTSDEPLVATSRRPVEDLLMRAEG